MQCSPGKVSLCAALGWLAADAGVAHADALASAAMPSGGGGLLTATVLVAGGLALLWFYFDERRRLRFDAVVRGATATVQFGRHEPTMELDVDLDDAAVLVPPPLPPPPGATIELEPEMMLELDPEPEAEPATTVDPMPARLAPPPAAALPQRRQPARPLPRISERLGAGPAPSSAAPRRGSAGALA